MKEVIALLIADADPAFRATFTEAVRRLGYEVWEAATAHEAWTITRDRQPDVVLLAPTLPDRSGTELGRQIKNDPALIGTRVVLLSRPPPPSTPDPAKPVPANADEFLDKALPPSKWEARIRAIVRRHHASAARRESALRELASIVENSADAIYGINLDGKIVSWNPAAVRLYGYTAQEIIGQSAALLAPPERNAEYASILQDLSRGRIPQHFETFRRNKEGSLIEVSVTISPRKDAHGAVLGASCSERDITERRHLEREVIDISANERRRIGHELHDSAGQFLSGIAFRAKALEQRLTADALPHAEAARELIRLLELAVGQLRNLARGLSPITVDASGFVAALHNLAADTAHLFCIKCQVHCADSDLLIRPAVGLELYRITQEALHNAIDHGNARTIDIHMAMDATHLRLCIRDDGVGFKPELKLRPGIGLRLMEYRAHSIGGTLKFDSRPGKGAEVSCLVPRVLCFVPRVLGFTSAPPAGWGRPTKSN